MMNLDNRPRHSGGCQCGAVCFQVEGALGDASICHCRMCQKASGNFFLALVCVCELVSNQHPDHDTVDWPAPHRKS